MIIVCIISFIVGAMLMMCAIGLMSYQKDKKPRNNVHFIVTKQERLSLVVLNKSQEWYHLCDEEDFIYWNLNPDNFADMKNGDIREVFTNLED